MGAAGKSQKKKPMFQPITVPPLRKEASAYIMVLPPGTQLFLSSGTEDGTVCVYPVERAIQIISEG